MKYFLVSLFAALMASQVHAAEIAVAGDSLMTLELHNTIESLKKSLRRVSSANELCECRGSSSQCERLRELNDEQLAFCKKVAVSTAQDLLGLFERKRRIKFVWSSKPDTDHGSSIKADVDSTNRSVSIVLDEDRFAHMDVLERSQYLAQELLLFVQLDGQPLREEGEYGPFKGAEGGRSLLETLSAAFVIEGMRAKSLPLWPNKLSEPFRSVYLAAQWGRRSLSSDEKRSMFAEGYFETSSLSVSYFPKAAGRLGVRLGYDRETMSDGEIVRSEASRSFVHGGVEGRFLPFTTSTAFLNAIQMSFYLGGGAGQYRHRLSDDYVTLEQGGKFRVLACTGRIYLPIVEGFWFTYESGLVLRPYRAEQLGIESKQASSETLIGVSYGF